MAPATFHMPPLEPTNEPRWLITRNIRNSVVESSYLPAGSDLQSALDRARANWEAAGWTIVETDQNAGRFVCEHGTDRRTIMITAEPPAPRGRMRKPLLQLRI